MPIIEGVLFLSGDKGVSIAELILITNLDQMTLEEEIQNLNIKYQNDKTSIFTIISTSNTYKLVTKKEYFKYLEKYSLLNTSNKLSQSALETLAIIAYKQPITKFEIEKTKGLNVSHTLHTLIDKNLVYISGKSKEISNPNIYSTTDKFLDYIGINSLENLPNLDKFKVSDDPNNLFVDNTFDYGTLSKLLLSNDNTFVVKEIDQKDIEELKNLENIDIELEEKDERTSTENHSTK